MNKPTGLAAAGRRFHEAVSERFELRVDEEALLLAACRTIDEIVLLEKALKASDMTVSGSMGQVRIHPAVAELRAHRSCLAALVKQLGLPDDVEPGADLRSPQHVAAANARWDRVRALKAEGA